MSQEWQPYMPVKTPKKLKSKFASIERNANKVDSTKTSLSTFLTKSPENEANVIDGSAINELASGREVQKIATDDRTSFVSLKPPGVKFFPSVSEEIVEFEFGELIFGEEVDPTKTQDVLRYVFKLLLISSCQEERERTRNLFYHLHESCTAETRDDSMVNWLVDTFHSNLAHLFAKSSEGGLPFKILVENLNASFGIFNYVFALSPFSLRVENLASLLKMVCTLTLDFSLDLNEVLSQTVSVCVKSNSVLFMDEKFLTDFSSILFDLTSDSSNLRFLFEFLVSLPEKSLRFLCIQLVARIFDVQLTFLDQQDVKPADLEIIRFCLLLETLGSQFTEEFINLDDVVKCYNCSSMLNVCLNEDFLRCFDIELVKRVRTALMILFRRWKTAQRNQLTDMHLNFIKLSLFSPLDAIVGQYDTDLYNCSFGDSETMSRN